MDVYGELEKVVKEERREKFKVANMLHRVKNFYKETKLFFRLVWFEIAPVFHVGMTIFAGICVLLFAIAYIVFTNGNIEKIDIGFVFKTGIALSSFFAIGSAIRIAKSRRERIDFLQQEER